ncbi:hypothetical protein [Sandaracinus amylolyticus]|uniref:hypothetical protein n=1 Tax=Sandaracinus amylolyticus TaxID=927083 RepID=UPI001F284A00|nr:hypothetical protein [Sandaracinus amylolyticus]UJR84296.1 Hypothetical protein I5071_63740 [Sandaracinus amylolyticus]
MSRNNKIRFAIVVGLALALAACGYFTGSVATYLPHTGAYDFSRVALLRSPDTQPDQVVLFATPSTCTVMNVDGSMGTGQCRRPGTTDTNLGFSLTSVAPGTNRQVWALTDGGTRVRRLTFNSLGTLTAITTVISSTGWANEDIAVSGDGATIYLVGGSSLTGYSSTGAWLGSVPVQRDGTITAGSRRRVAVDRTRDRVVVIERVVQSGTNAPKMRFSMHHSAIAANGYSVLQPFGFLDVDVAGEIVDFDIDADNLVLEHSVGLDPTTLEVFYWPGGGFGATRYGTRQTYWSSFGRAGTLTGRGVVGDIAACGGSGGAYLWRARTNAGSGGYMLERHTICAEN